MNKTYTPEQWFELAKDLHGMIMSETDNVSDLPAVYPKLVIMYEFFRFVRGESFYSIRPGGMGDHQGEIYKMQDEIGAKLKALESTLDPEDEKVKFYLDQMKRYFGLKYFNPSG